MIQKVEVTVKFTYEIDSSDLDNVDGLDDAALIDEQIEFDRESAENDIGEFISGTNAPFIYVTLNKVP